MSESYDDYMTRQRAYWAARATTPLPPIVEEALRRIAAGEALLSVTAWIWTAADTDSRLAVDAWILTTKCSLQGMQGRERRFRLLVDSEHETRLNEAREAQQSGRAP